MSDAVGPFPVEALVDALRRHAAVTAREDAPPLEAIRAISEVRTTALAYVEAVFDGSGWSNVFDDLYDEEGLEAESVDDGLPLPESDGRERLTVTGRWEVVVNDEEALRAEVMRRMAAAGEVVSDDPPDGVLELLGTLLAVSGPVDAPGLEEVGGSWSVAPAEGSRD